MRIGTAVGVRDRRRHGPVMDMNGQPR
jgi:hypothetical protein